VAGLGIRVCLLQMGTWLVHALAATHLSILASVRPRVYTRLWCSRGRDARWPSVYVRGYISSLASHVVLLVCGTQCQSVYSRLSGYGFRVIWRRRGQGRQNAMKNSLHQTQEFLDCVVCQAGVEAAERAVAACSTDSDSPLLVYVSKMVAVPVAALPRCETDRKTETNRGRMPYST
jgi:hypothetical protein